eukprot:SAG31_NODE_21_length_34109_cov_60.598824_16_plen_62_part_00
MSYVVMALDASLERDDATPNKTRPVKFVAIVELEVVRDKDSTVVKLGRYSAAPLDLVRAPQ